MAAHFPRGKQPEFSVHCTGTRKLCNLIWMAHNSDKRAGTQQRQKGWHTTATKGRGSDMVMWWSRHWTEDQEVASLNPALPAFVTFIPISLVSGWCVSVSSPSDEMENRIPCATGLRTSTICLFKNKPWQHKTAVLAKFCRNVNVRK